MHIKGSYYEDLHTNGHRSQSWFYTTREERLISFAQLKKTHRVLDIGCGSGTITRNILRTVGCTSIGIDVSEECIKYASEKSIQEGLASDFLVGSIESLPFIEKTFDIVIASHIIEHVPFPEKIFLELKRILKDGGILLLTTPNYTSFWPLAELIFDHTIAKKGYSLHDQHITKFNPSMIKKLFKKTGFSDTVVETYYTLSLPLSLISSRWANFIFSLEKNISSLPIGTIIYAKGRK